jgi:hypothetical protein
VIGRVAIEIGCVRVGHPVPPFWSAAWQALRFATR